MYSIGFHGPILYVFILGDLSLVLRSGISYSSIEICNSAWGTTSRLVSYACLFFSATTWRSLAAASGFWRASGFCLAQLAARGCMSFLRLQPLSHTDRFDRCLSDSFCGASGLCLEAWRETDLCRVYLKCTRPNRSISKPRDTNRSLSKPRDLKYSTLCGNRTLSFVG